MPDHAPEQPNPGLSRGFLASSARLLDLAIAVVGTEIHGGCVPVTPIHKVPVEPTLCHLAWSCSGLINAARLLLDLGYCCLQAIMGPRVLLAFCHFYKRELRQLTLPAGVHIVDTFTLSRTVAQHLPLAYKHRGAHWNHQKQRNRSLFRNPSGRPRAA